MTPVQNELQASDSAIYNHAASLLLNQRKNSIEVIDSLVQQGYDQQHVSTIVDTVEQHIAEARKQKANKDMLYGALWCVGGTVATLANIGFIFWGAIVFGGIQFFRGVMNAVK